MYAAQIPLLSSKDLETLLLDSKGAQELALFYRTAGIGCGFGQPCIPSEEMVQHCYCFPSRLYVF